MRNALRGFLSVVLILTAAGCGSDSPAGPSGSSSGSSGGSSSSSKGTLTAIIDGVAYSGIVNAASRDANGTLNIASNTTDLTRAIAFALSNSAVGTFNISASTSLSMTTQTTNGSTVTGVWIAAATLGSGTLTITSLSATGVTGSFSFNAPANSQGATGTKVVTSGAFAATF